MSLAKNQTKKPAAKKTTKKAPRKTATTAANVPFMFSTTKDLPKPLETQLKGRPWLNWGDNNLYPDYLNKLFYESPYQSGIIRQKVFFIAGGGYSVDFKTPEDEEAFNAFLNGMPKEHLFNDVLDHNTLDGELYNGVAIRGVYESGGGKVSFLEAVDFDKIRSNEKETEYYFSNDWGTNKQSAETTGYKIYKPYNPLKREGEFLVYYRYPSKEYRPDNQKVSKGIYPTPNYSGGLKDLATDIEMSSYHFHEILNGFKMGTIIYLGSGLPNPKDKKKIEAEIKAGSTGIESSGGILIMYGKGEDQKPEVVHLNGNDLDKRYLMTEVAVQKKILVSHSVVTPVLFGIVTAGSLGNSTELANGYNIFVKTYVRARQKALESLYNLIIKDILKIDATITINEGELLTETEEEVTNPDTVEPDKVVQAKSRKDDPILNALQVAGKPRKNFIIVTSKELDNEITADEVATTEVKHMKDTLKTSYRFATLFTDSQVNFLSLLNDGHDIKSAADVLKITEKAAGKIYEDLQNAKFIKKNGELTSKGLTALNSTPANIDKFEVRYSYELSEDLKAQGKPEILPNNRTRSFCSTLIKEDRLYTREEINLISAAVSRNTWAYRGGWWNDKGTNKPFCRHIWKQNVVFNTNK